MIRPSIITPSTVRHTEPTPPKMLVPPSATPAIAVRAMAWLVGSPGEPCAESRVVEQPREPGREAGDDEGRDHDPVDLEPGQPRGVAVPADPVDVAAEDGSRKDDLEHDRDDDEDDHRVLHAAELVLAEERPDVRVALRAAGPGPRRRSPARR